MKGRFLYIGPFQLPDRNAAAHRVLGIAKGLKALDYETMFLDMASPGEDARPGEMHDTCGFETCTRPYPTGLAAWCGYASKAEYAEQMLARHNDWKGIIAYNYPALSFLRLAGICRERGLMLLADCTEWYRPDFHTPHTIAVTADSCLRMRMAHRHADCVIAISSYLAKYYSKSTRTVVIPPTVDMDDSKWHTDEKRQDGRLRLYYVGSYGRNSYKDRLDRIIDALHASGAWERMEFHIVGVTLEQYLARYGKTQEFIGKLAEGGTLHFHGALPHSKALELLKMADYSVFLRPVNRMTTAGFPTKFVESIACGVPVISTRTSDLGKYLEEGRNGFFVNMDEGLSRLLAKLKPLGKDFDRSIFDYRKYLPELRQAIGDSSK